MLALITRGVVVSAAVAVLMACDTPGGGTPMDAAVIPEQFRDVLEWVLNGGPD